MPNSVAGLIALLDYAAEFVRGGNEWPENVVDEDAPSPGIRKHGIAWEVKAMQAAAAALRRIDA